MEEILASIRKIIADEPSRELTPETRPLPKLTMPIRESVARDQPALAAQPAAPPSKLSARLNDAFGQDPALPLKPRMSLAKLSTDDDLDDLLADPVLPNGGAATPRTLPTQPARPLPSLQTPMMSRPASPTKGDPFEAPGPALARPAAGPDPFHSASSIEPGQPRSKPIVIAAMPSPAAVLAPAPTPPPRTAEFNGPAPYAKSPSYGPTGRAAEHESSPPVVTAQALTEAPATTTAWQPQPAEDPLERPSERLSEPVVLAAMPARDARTAAEAAPLAGFDLPPAAHVITSETPPTIPAVEMFEAAEPNVSATLLPEPALAQTDAPGPIAEAAPTPAWVPAPTVAAMAIGLDTASQRLDPPFQEPTPTNDAVTSALEALAARLASPSVAAPAPEIIAMAVEVTQPSATVDGPVSATDVDLETPVAAPAAALSKDAASVSVFTSPDSFVGGVALTPMPMRTLDDTAAELLRPMLRHWLDENMPRIVEKALRIEMAQVPLIPTKTDGEH